MLRLKQWFAIIGLLGGLLSLCLLPPALTVRVRAEGPQVAQDQGLTGLVQMLRKLRTTARMIHTTAHPDDEDGGMLALESRGRGASVLLLTLNRGEGGQNKTGSELFDELGILRTLELLAADKYYGVEQRFTRVVDFGFSKNAEETFNQWHGHDIALGDMVRVIRTFRPDVLVTRFQRTPRDEHGNHQASGILTREAFRAAADPHRFADQIKEGLLPWQARKLYVRSEDDYTVRLDPGAYDPALGISYAQFAREGLAHQLSQGSGGSLVSAGHHYSYYKLIESVVPEAAVPDGIGTSHEPRTGHEGSLFDGIDTTLPALADRLGNEARIVPFLRSALTELERTVNEAESVFTPKDPSRTATALLRGLKTVKQLISQLESSSLSAAAKAELLTHLRTKQRQFEGAANLALGLDLEATVDAPRSESFLMASPGQTFTLTAKLYDTGRRAVVPERITLTVPAGWESQPLRQNLGPLSPGENASVQYRLKVASDAAYTRPYWHRNDPQTEAVYTLDDPRYVTLPFPPLPVHAEATYSVGDDTGEIRAIAQVQYIDPVYGQERRPLAVGPPLSVELEPSARVMATNNVTTVGAPRTSPVRPTEVSVGIRNNLTGPVNASLRLEVPSGWQVDPATHAVWFERHGEYKNLRFLVRPASLREGRYEIKAVVEYQGRDYTEGYDVVTRRDLGTFYYYHPAVQRVSAIALQLPRKLKVGYIMGAGDDIPSVLQQIGVNVEMISPAELASGDLSRLDTIIVGIRAYDVRNDVRENNQRLLDFVERGGTLIVQYNQNTASFNAGHYTPYPATAGSARVSVEQAPVEFLDPADAILQYPNRITALDFDGWVQERGLYFMNQWDPHFRPLLASHDPGEPPLQGGLLRARYGKGTYLFTAYAFFRQLPAGVPGAIRLFVNLMSAGHKGSDE